MFVTTALRQIGASRSAHHQIPSAVISSIVASA
jgi:hypothetical protein